MRPEAEVLEMVASLRRINDGLWAQMKQVRAVGTEVEEDVFNSNGRLICALEWALGGDTIKVQEHGVSITVPMVMTVEGGAP